MEREGGEVFAVGVGKVGLVDVELVRTRHGPFCFVLADSRHLCAVESLEERSVIGRIRPNGPTFLGCFQRRSEAGSKINYVVSVKVGSGDDRVRAEICIQNQVPNIPEDLIPETVDDDRDELVAQRVGRDGPQSSARGWL